MSTRTDDTLSPPVESRDALVGYLEAGCKPRRQWVIGTEHEKFGTRLRDLSPVPYHGADGIEALLLGLVDRFAYRPVLENGTVIALKSPVGLSMGTVSLEPGGQLELSGAPVGTVHETEAETRLHLEHVRAVAENLGLGFFGFGFSPLWSLAETPAMPKGRYAIMTRHMPKVGKHGLDMMYRSCTVQVNLDFSSEADMVKKFRVSLALQPAVAALCANSPITEGQPNGYQSFRSAVWMDTDPYRTGMLPFVFERGMSFERYTDYLLDVPMYFVYRDGRYVDVAGDSFRRFMEGRLDALPGERPSLDDWADHISTAFPEVRMKRFLEMRGADAGAAWRMSAIAALWAGLLYDGPSLDAAHDLIKTWTAEERQELRHAVPRAGLEAPFRDATVLPVVRAMLAIARQGLAARNRIDAKGHSEVIYLEPLDAIAEAGVTDASNILASFEGPWHRDPRQLIDALTL